MVRFITSVFFLLLFSSVRGECVYYSYPTGFGSFAKTGAVAFEQNRLVFENARDLPLFSVDTILRDNNATFKFSIRIANLHNKEGKSYHYFESSDKKKRKIANTECGAVWNYIDEQNYYAVLMKCYNTCLHDILDRRYMVVDIVKCENGRVSSLKTVEIDKNVDLYEGYNMIRIAYDGELTAIYIGDKHYNLIATFSDIQFINDSKFGVVVNKGCAAAVERIVMKWNHDVTDDLATSWNKASIESYLSKSSDRIEGYWDYLDRNLHYSTLKLGGKYKVALVKNNTGYDIIYIDGAKINNRIWRCGMKKGELKAMPFIDTYRLVWYDAEKELLDNDLYATIDNSMILTLHFPAEKSQIRLYKIATAGH